MSLYPDNCISHVQNCLRAGTPSIRRCTRNKELLCIPCDNGLPDKICFTRVMHGVTEETEIVFHTKKPETSWCFPTYCCTEEEFGMSCSTSTQCWPTLPFVSKISSAAAALLISEWSLQRKNISSTASILREATVAQNSPVPSRLHVFCSDVSCCCYNYRILQTWGTCLWFPSLFS